jgi:glycosyltransferase involved in cell wall biosynthesis
MQISYVTNQGDLHQHGGYGVAGYGIVTSLQRLGHRVPWDDPAAPVQFNFCFPSVFADSLRKNQHQIYLCAWESTKLQPDWYDILDHEVDEIWAASDWVKGILEDNNYKVEKVYRHGVDPMWAPVKRDLTGPIRFLYEGGASRKNPQFVFDAFKAAFGDDADVQLIMKEKYSSDVRVYNNGNIVGVPGGNVIVISKIYSEEQMVKLFNLSHCFVSASSGEGYGLPGQQALATGIPVIATKECSPYTQFLDNLGLESEYVDSPWPDLHPGQILKPDFDDLVDKYRYVRNNIESLLPKYYKQSFKVHDYADWDTLTDQAFSDIVTRFDVAT